MFDTDCSRYTYLHINTVRRPLHSGMRQRMYCGHASDANDTEVKRNTDNCDISDQGCEPDCSMKKGATQIYPFNKGLTHNYTLVGKNGNDLEHASINSSKISSKYLLIRSSNMFSV